MRAFIAQEVHSAGDLNTEVFRAIQTCDAFLAILQKRGAVTFAPHPQVERSSVWIQQEFAVFCYRMFLEQRSLPVRVYSERGIRREGVMEIAVANPIEFDRRDEVVGGVNEWLKSREFEEHPVLARREDHFRVRFEQTSEDEQLLLELIAVHCLEPNDAIDHQTLRLEFHAVINTTGSIEASVENRFNAAYATLRHLGLIVIEASHIMTRIWIVKQWWQLIHDELRSRGERV